MVCSHAINRLVYNFLLKLPKLKVLQFMDKYGITCIVTYNLKYFKRKSLLMRSHRSNRYISYKTSIIFIL